MTEGYPVCRLGAVASVQGGFAFKSSDFTGTGVPVLKIKNVRLRDVDTTEPAYVDHSVAKETARYFCKTGDLLISMTGSGPQAPNSVVGRVARFTGPSDRYLINQRVGRFVNKAPDKLDQRYLFYVLAQDETLWKLVSVATGSANQANISGSQIERLEVPLPPLPEQKRIAHILGTLDDKIELNRRMNKILEEMSRALFKSWFIDFDPVIAKSESRQPEGMDAATAKLFPSAFEDSELGRIPKGWRVGSIYEISDVIYGAPFASNQFNATGEGKPLIRIRDLTDESPGVWTPEVHPKGYTVQPGDIVVGMDGEFRAYLWGGVPAWLNQRACVFAPKNYFSSVFVRNSIIAPLAEVEATETATTVIHLGKNDIDRFKFVIPPLPIHAVFAKICQPWYNQIVLNKQQSRTLSTLRDTLLPKLLSGELGVGENSN